MAAEHRTKIVATLGPASSDPAVIRALIEEGVNVIRLNFSHGTHDEHRVNLREVRRVAAELGKPVAVLQDLQGPKIRLGEIPGGFVDVVAGETLVLTTDGSASSADGSKTVPIDYPGLHEEVAGGDRIFIDDGLFEIRVASVEGHAIRTTVVNGGRLKQRKGVNLPNIPLKISALTEEDKSDLAFAFEENVDYVALSFVRRSDDVRELKDHMRARFGRVLPVVSKIEKPEALSDIDAILRESDALMVARGDLGVETSPQDVPLIQKYLIRLCNHAGKPVITATQMLESMITNPRPTRAEAGDVANAILDGSDAIMLSAETAAGKYPVESVRMMKTIAQKVESNRIFKRTLTEKNVGDDEMKGGTRRNPEESVSFATVELADKIEARAIVTFTFSGGTARKISKYRPTMPIVALSHNPETVRRLSMVWGVVPVAIDTMHDINELLAQAEALPAVRKLANPGDFIVITGGVPLNEPGSTNIIKVMEIGK